MFRFNDATLLLSLWECSLRKMRGSPKFLHGYPLVPLVFRPAVVNGTTTLCFALDSFIYGPLAAVLFLKRIPSFVMRIISVPVIAIVMGCVSVPVPAPFSVCLNHSAFLEYTGSPLRRAGCLGCSCQVPSFLISTVLLLFAQDLLSVKGGSS